MHYTKITDASFLPGLLSDGDVWQCNLVTAKWVVDHGYGFYSDSAGDAATPPWGATGADVPAPVLESAAVENAAPTEVVINFSGGIEITDTTGITVTVDAGGATVNSAVASGDVLTVTLAAGVANGEVVLFSYDADTGNLQASGEGNAAVADITDAAVTNNVAV